jgi:hypothetical protein
MNEAAVAVLNDLLGAEYAAIAPRLFEAGPFISRLSVKDVETAERISRASPAHCEALTGLILELGGVPGPRRVDVTVADLHYQELHFVLGRLVADHERLVERYRRALGRLAGTPRASALVGRLLAQHEAELSGLRELVPLGQKKAS